MKLVCLISFFFFISTTSLAAVSPPNPTLYQNFLQCFSNQTKSLLTPYPTSSYPKPHPLSPLPYAPTSETRVSTLPPLPNQPS
uniref:Uncharacterized protein n=1 Tax=Brassica campestris TaxID=3711 RepID=A0A3P5YWX8_BRACM|nr:unnamed protein product [Brassica rapa]